MKQLFETIRLAAQEGFLCSFDVWQHSTDREAYISSFSVHRHGTMIAFQHRRMSAKEVARLIARLTDFAC